MYYKNNIIVKFEKDEFNFYVIVNITKYYYIVKKIQKRTEYLLDKNERLYKDVTPLAYVDDDDNIIKYCMNRKINKINHLTIDNYERFNINKNYIEAF